MGNCQAAEAATVVIQHPGGGRVERAYWALSAGAVMAANPGHYVAAVITSPSSASAAPSSAASGAAPVKHLKLLRPDDTLLLGRVYRLVSFEEVLREFASKRHVKLSRVIIKAKEEEKPADARRRGGADVGDAPAESERSLAKVMRQAEESDVDPSDPNLETNPPTEPEFESAALLAHGMMFGRRIGPARHGHWRPVLQSIAEGGVAS